MHRKALVIKFLLIFAVLFFMLSIFEYAAFLDILFISLILTGASYIIGDLLLLPRTSIVFATIADFVLNFAALWLLSALLIEQAYPIGIVTGFASFFIACGEGFFHRYMLDHVLDENEEEADDFIIGRYQTEFAEEETLKSKRED